MHQKYMIMCAIAHKPNCRNLKVRVQCLGLVWLTWRAAGTAATSLATAQICAIAYQESNLHHGGDRKADQPANLRLEITQSQAANIANLTVGQPEKNPANLQNTSRAQ